MSDRYSIKDKIGQGGLGAVYKAYDNNLGRDVALKRVLPAEGEDPHEMALNLVKEAKTLSALQHPHIVTVYDVGEDAKGPYVVMELLKGETLDATIKRGALPAEDFENVVTQSLEALVAAQALGITHRDLKPANIMVIWLPSGKFQIKILDFGLAKFSSQPSVQTIDQSESILGSIYFMAPEQFERLPLDSRTDLYSLGAILYFTLTAQYPFQGDNAPQVMAAHMQNRFKPLASLRPDLPAYIPSWVEWLMSRSPDDRPSDATQALQYFHQKKSGKAPTAPPAAQPSRPATGSTSNRLVRKAPAGTTSGKLVTPAPKPGKLAAGATAAPAATPSAAPVAAPVAAAAANVVPEEETADVVPIDTAEIRPIAGPSFFSRIPKWALITAPTMLVTVACIAVYMYLKWKAEDERREKFQEILTRVQTDDAPGNTADIKVLASYLDDPNSDVATEAASAMIRLEGDEINRAMIGYLSKFKGSALVNLISALAERRNPASFDAILPYTRSKQSNVRKAAFNALGTVGDTSKIPELFSLLESVTESTERDFLENAVLNITVTNPDLDGRTTFLVGALPSASKETKKSLLTVLGTLGGSDAFKALSDALKSPDADIRLQAAQAFSNWPGAKPLKLLADFVKTEEDASAEIVAYRTIGYLAGYPGPLAESEVQALLEESLGDTENKRSQNVIHNAMGGLADDSAATFFKGIESEPSLKGIATAALENIAKVKKEVVTLGNGGSLPAQKAQLPVEAFIQGGILKEWYGIGNNMAWRFSVSQGGTFKIEIDQGSNATDPGSYSIHIGDKAIAKSVRNTDGKIETVKVGEVRLETPGIYKVWIKPITTDEDERVMDLKELRLIPN